MSDAPDPDIVRQRLAAFHARRGYLMAHQGVMAAALPELQEAYGVMYRALTLDDHHLPLPAKEFVWLAILVAAGEHIGKHHIDLFQRNGGTDAQAAVVFRLAAFGAGASAFELLDRHWQGHFPEVPATREYVRAQRALAGDVALPPHAARLATLATQVARRHQWSVAAEIEAAYAESVPEPQMAEAMSLAMWPCGINCFLDSAQTWLELIRAGRVTASPAFLAWAQTPGQDGFVLPPRAAPVKAER